MYADGEYGAVELYEPIQIRRQLRKIGFEIEDVEQQVGTAGLAREVSVDMKLVQRALRIFSRATGVNERTMQMRLGVNFNRFRKEILPSLLDAGILEELRYEGRGSQRRFGIAAPMRRIEDAIEKSRGELRTFLAAFRGAGSSS